jgi:CHAD domain-containing protein
MTPAPVSRDHPAKRQLVVSVDEALSKLRTKRITDHRIHQARRALKKARAALRVLRPALGEKTYRLENVTLRDAGRHLSPLRDAKAAIETFDALTTRFADRLRGFDLVPLRQALELEQVSVRRTMRPPSVPVQACIALLETHRDRSRGVLPAGLTLDAMALKKIYRKGRKTFVAATKAGTPDALHEWRKQVKYLLNAVEAVKAELGPRAEKLLRRAGKIADLLGEDHDLAALMAIAEGDPAGLLAPDAKHALASTVAHRRSKLQRRAVHHGDRAYKHKPGRFLHGLLEGASDFS